jgi:hypothetical protein
MWMDFGCETSFVPEMPETSQHFFYEVIRPGLADKRKRGKSYFIFFCGLRAFGRRGDLQSGRPRPRFFRDTAP